MKKDIAEIKEKIKSKEEEAEKRRKEREGEIQKEGCEIVVEEERKKPPPLYEVLEPSPLYPAAHRAVEIRFEPGRGRFAVAADDIPMGTAVIHEQPVTYSLYPEK